MAQDYAKKGRSSRTKKTPARKQQTQRSAAKGHSGGRGWQLYFAGVATGLFISFLAYLGALPTSIGSVQDQQALAQPAEPVPKPRFDFYTLLPQQTFETDPETVAVEPAADVSKPNVAASADVYVLQAGSFRQRTDADQRRAELLLLGLEPRVQEAVSDNVRVFRVYLGPFESHAAMTKARGLTANQNIATLLLKRGNP